MPFSVAENSDHIRFRRPRTQSFSETDPNPITQSARCKQTISSLLLSSSPPTSIDCTIPSLANYPKKKNFTAASWRGLGCAASSQVSVPAVIRTSADWEAKKVKKKKVRKRYNNSSSNTNSSHQPPASNPPSIAMDELWCGPGIGFNSDSAASIDCFVSRRAIPIPERHASVSAMRTMNLESSHTLMDTFGGRYHRHARHRSTQGLAEMMMLQGRLLMGARAGGLDQYRDWRLDVDRMSYEELLELGDRIGYVNTGLKEDDIVTCLRKINISVTDHKCSICQEEYGTEDEMGEVGELGCGHGFHFHCIEQWLVRKNICPVCKTAANGPLA